MIEYENLGKLNAPFYKDFKKSVDSLLKSGWYILGQNVTKFEQDFSEYIGVDHGVGVANGLDALILGLKALNLRPDDEVLVPSNTYIATILAILHAGLKPVLVEPNLRTYNIDPSQIEQKISRKTRAIIVVHLYGKACDMDPIVSLCEQYNLRLLEDCSQSHGAKYKGKMTGSFGDFGCFSFYPTKNLGALGDAGAIVCRDQELAKKVRKLRNYGSSKKYHNDVVGHNSRLDEVQAGFLNIKLKALADITNHKRMLAKLYFEYLDHTFIKPEIDSDYFDVYHIYNVRLEARDGLRAFMLENGVQTEIHYPVSPHRQLAMKNICQGEYPVSDEIHRTTLSLPISFCNTKEEIIQVCRVINKFKRNNNLL
jgi:dTDP-4-amino-4,6-dideoxygalactose transaminase